jgi:hypothetical protein
MLRKDTKKRIQSRKWENHSNKNQMFKRIKDQTDDAITDLTLIAEKLPEDRLEQIFTEKKLEPFFRALMKIHGKDRDRTFGVGYAMLKSSLNVISVTFGNKWAQKLYSEHEIQLREILDMLHHEKKKLQS